jgi:hypothetical protein
MISKVLVAAFLLPVATLTVNASEQETESKSSNNAKISDVVKKDETQKNIDQEITNARMRATLGSKSKWSIKASMSYSGGTVIRPAAEVRPDYQNSSDPSRDKPSLSSFGASVGVKYSLSERQSLTVGTGLTLNNPFHGDLTRSQMVDPRSQFSDKTINRTEVQNPYVDYTYAGKLGSDLQMYASTRYTVYTSDVMKNKLNGFGSLSTSVTLMGDFGTSGWSGGLTSGVSLSQWNGEPQVDAYKGTQSDFDFYLIPFTEYAFNDRYSFRTVFGWLAVEHLKDGPAGTDRAAVSASVPYQSMGVGISMTRDIYLYPNVQFTPFDIRAERTNVALSANINIF